MPPLVVTIAAAVATGSTIGVLGTIAFGTVTFGAILGVVITIGGALYQAKQARKAASAAGQAALRGPVIATAPHYRFLFGKLEVEGTRVFRYVLGTVRYDAYIMNARPSLGGFAFKLNDTRVTLKQDADNDLYDVLKGTEIAEETWEGYVRLWMSTGDHSQPPQQFLDELDTDVFSATDIGLGMTMLWVRCDYGPNESGQARWNGKIPSFKVDGYWSRVFDPRKPSHDVADPDSFDWSATPALIALDLLLNKHALARPLNSVVMADFAAGASSEERNYTRIDGDTEHWYECHGAVELQTREYDLLAPVLQCAAARHVKVGGMHHYVPGEYQHSGLTLGNPVGDSLEYSEEDQFSAVPGGIETRFISERRGWVQTTLPILWSAKALTGGVNSDRLTPLSLGMVSSATQGMRLQQAYLRGLTNPRKLTATFGPEAERVCPGDVITIDTAEMPVINGIYEVQEATPEYRALDAGGYALRFNLALAGQPVDQFEFTQADELPFTEALVDPVPRPEILPISALSVMRSGGDLVFDFNESPSPSTECYRLRVKTPGSGLGWQTVQRFDAQAPSEARSIKIEIPAAHDGENRKYSIRAHAPFGVSQNNQIVII